MEAFVLSEVEQMYLVWVYDELYNIYFGSCFYHCCGFFYLIIVGGLCLTYFTINSALILDIKCIIHHISCIMQSE